MRGLSGASFLQRCHDVAEHFALVTFHFNVLLIRIGPIAEHRCLFLYQVHNNNKDLVPGLPTFAGGFSFLVRERSRFFQYACIGPMTGFTRILNQHYRWPEIYQACGEASEFSGFQY